ncbi:MAG: hypothetical protein RR334_03460 [Clostridia bacterium]
MLTRDEAICITSVIYDRRDQIDTMREQLRIMTEIINNNGFSGVSYENEKKVLNATKNALLIAQSALIEEESAHLIDLLDYKISEHKKLIMPSRPLTTSVENDAINKEEALFVKELEEERRDFLRFNRTKYTMDYNGFTSQDGNERQY